MTHTEIGQAVTRNRGLIRGIVCKTLRKFGSNLCEADVDDIQSITSCCLLDGRLSGYRFTTEKRLQQWIGYIAMQRCIDYLRGLKRTIPLDVGDADSPSKLARELLGLAHHGNDPEEAYLEKEHQTERRARLKAAVSSLSQGDQGAFDAMTTNGYTVRAYASREGIKESTAHTRRFRLIRNLRKSI